PHAAVRRHDALAGPLAPGLDHAFDRARIDTRPVAEHDHGGLDLVPERREPIAERRAGPALPLRAVDHAGARLHLVRTEDGQHLVDRVTLAHALDDGLEQHGLLR